MAEKPGQQHDPLGEGPKAARGKGRAAPAIDLPASHVVDVTPDVTPEVVPEIATPDAKAEDRPAATRSAEASGTASPPNEPPARAPSPGGGRLAPALIGLIAGAIGGFGASQFGDALRSKPPQQDSALAGRLGTLEQRLAGIKPGDAAPPVPEALLARLGKAEAQLVEAEKREAGLRAELAKLDLSLTNEATERKKAIETLGSRPVDATNGAGGSSLAAAEVEALRTRLGTLEAAVRSLPSAVTALGARLDGLQPRLETVTKDVQALSGRVAGLSTGEVLGAANARLAAVSLLDEALTSGQPLGPALDMAKNLGADAAALAAFAPFAASGAPGAKKLLEELRALKPAPAAATATAPSPTAGIFDRVKQGAAALVEVRRAGEPGGTEDAAVLTRTEQALERGDIAGAYGQIIRLSPEKAGVYAPWRARVEARLKAVEALAALRRDAQGVLAKAAAPAK